MPRRNRSRNSGRVLRTLALIVLSLSAADVARADDSLEAVLARPISPGTLALLIPYSTSPQAAARWTEALKHPDAHVRATAARLLHVSVTKSALAPLKDALAAEPDPGAGREMALAAIRLGGPADDDAILKAAERLKLSDVPSQMARARGRPVPAQEGSPGDSPAAFNSEFGSVRTASDFPEGYVADVLTQTGCLQPDFSDFGGAIVMFDGNRLAQLHWVANSLPAGCAAASRYITAASLSPLWDPVPGKASLVLTPMHKAYLQCLASETTPVVDSGLATRQAPIHVGRDIKPPKKIRNVSPVYPPGAVQARVQGTVIIEAVISETGCVESAKLLRGVTTEVDAAAFRAVTGWLFAPTLLNGTAVPVIMTVTVQFTLK